MSNIDVKRLAKDRAYWDLRDPTGEATHFDEDAMLFIKKNGRDWLHWVGQQGWCGFAPVRKAIPRPEPTTEWDGEGLPPVGCECERHIGKDVYRVTVIGYHDGAVVVYQHDAAPDYTDVQPGYLKPLPTKAEREREEVINQAIEKAGIFLNLENALHRIYDAGMLKKVEP